MSSPRTELHRALYVRMVPVIIDYYSFIEEMSCKCIISPDSNTSLFRFFSNWREILICSKNYDRSLNHICQSFLCRCGCSPTCTATQYHPPFSLLESDRIPLLPGSDSKNTSCGELDYESQSCSSIPNPCDVVSLHKALCGRPS